MKKAVILRATGGELANQLWNYASVYAYCLERGYALKNSAFYEYGNYFSVPAPSLFLKLFFFLPFTNYTKRKQSFKRRLWRKLYGAYAKAVISANKDSVLVSDNKDNHPFYLPPTKEDKRLSELEKKKDAIYFDGWLFRNPAGLQKYRKEIVEYFKPRQDIEKIIETETQDLRSRFANIIGVHVRQGDYKTWRDGAYCIPQTRVREILDEYLRTSDKNTDNTCFVITSDGPIDENLFKGLHISMSKSNAAHDLFLLSKSDAIIGSDSTFGAFASYYGNIPFIVMKKESLDWKQYEDKKEYFENNQSTFVYY